MGLFDEINLDGMSLEALDELIGIVEQMLLIERPTLERYQLDYSELLTRLRQRRQIVAQREFLAARSSARAGYQAAKQRYHTRVLLADQKLASERLAPNLLDGEEKVALGVLLQEEATAQEERDKYNSKERKSGPGKRAQTALNGASNRVNELLEILKQKIAAKEAQIEAARLLAMTPAIPAELAVEGWRQPVGRAYIYPLGGRLRHRGKDYLVNPNRTTVHHIDELPPAASVRLAGLYLASFVQCSLTLLDEQAFRGAGAGVQVRMQINDRTPSGRRFFWNLIAMKFDRADNQGNVGQIFHADSGYQANSRWRTEPNPP